MTLRLDLRDMTPADLEAQLAVFEDRYGVPSDRLEDAFRDERGELCECRDFREWCHVYTAWRWSQGYEVSA